MVLDNIKKENDIKKLSQEKYAELASEIRKFLIEHVSKTGGHLASNLGVVELTMALHISFVLPDDKIVWDVGHQSYTHKILTGRKDEFEHLREFGGMSGFPKRQESRCDSFDTGHSSTSISAGLGMACARDLKKDFFYVVSVIGDGSFTGGMVYEALNNAANIDSNFIIVLNDNGMSISRNVGSMSHYLMRMRTAKGYTKLKHTINTGLNRIPEVGDDMANLVHRAKNVVKQVVLGDDMFFEDMGITYIGPIDGHNIQGMCQAFEDAKRVQGPVLVHVMTEKGRGYRPAEEHPDKFHGIGPFDIATGKPIGKSHKSYTQVVSDTLVSMGAKHKNLVAITAAMADGTGLSAFSRKYPRRFFDVGIAEQHAVTFAAGLSSQGFLPFVAVYSSFLQRAYDQILHDVCMQNLPVIFGVDRAGLVGNDGETHQGVFDLSYLSSIPNLVVMAPKNGKELDKMMRFAPSVHGPVALRYSRGAASTKMEEYDEPIVLGKAEMLRNGCDVCFLALGSMVETAWDAAEKLDEAGISCSVQNMRFMAPLDQECIRSAAADHKILVTLEENVSSGGFGEHVEAFLEDEGVHTTVIRVCLPDRFIEQGTPSELKEKYGLDSDGIVKRVLTTASRFCTDMEE